METNEGRFQGEWDKGTSEGDEMNVTKLAL